MGCTQVKSPGSVNEGCRECVGGSIRVPVEGIKEVQMSLAPDGIGGMTSDGAT